jgi:hypothetical protein
MGWTVLYIAFGIVALWLRGEVLLQYKARLRWRLLAFAGFLGVVVGVLIPSVVVIGLGAAAFAVGQTYVTLSFRRGFAAGWAVGRPGADKSGGSKRRRRGGDAHQEPTLEVSDPQAVEDGAGDGPGGDAYGADGPAYGRNDTAAYGDDDRDDVFTPARPLDPTAAETTAVYQPQPVPEDTGSYGVYGGPADGGAQGPGPAQDQYAAAAHGTDHTYAYDYSGYAQQQYGYDAAGQQQYAGYTDPYATGTGAAYDTSYAGQQQYGQQDYGQTQYATGGYGETPPGGVWVPQQRGTGGYGGELPPEQPYPYQGSGQTQQPGFDEQYRF